MVGDEDTSFFCFFVLFGSLFRPHSQLCSHPRILRDFGEEHSELRMDNSYLVGMSSVLAAHPVTQADYPKKFGINEDGDHNSHDQLMTLYISSSGNRTSTSRRRRFL